MTACESRDAVALTGGGLSLVFLLEHLFGGLFRTSEVKRLRQKERRLDPSRHIARDREARRG